jgi:hypothetical protein
MYRQFAPAEFKNGNTDNFMYVQVKKMLNLTSKWQQNDPALEIVNELLEYGQKYSLDKPLWERVLKPEVEYQKWTVFGGGWTIYKDLSKEKSKEINKTAQKLGKRLILMREWYKKRKEVSNFHHIYDKLVIMASAFRDALLSVCEANIYNQVLQEVEGKYYNNKREEKARSLPASDSDADEKIIEDLFNQITPKKDGTGGGGGGYRFIRANSDMDIFLTHTLIGPNTKEADSNTKEADSKMLNFLRSKLMERNFQLSEGEFKEKMKEARKGIFGQNPLEKNMLYWYDFYEAYVGGKDFWKIVYADFRSLPLQYTSTQGKIDKKELLRSSGHAAANILEAIDKWGTDKDEMLGFKEFALLMWKKRDDDIIGRASEKEAKLLSDRLDSLKKIVSDYINSSKDDFVKIGSSSAWNPQAIPSGNPQSISLYDNPMVSRHSFVPAEGKQSDGSYKLKGDDTGATKGNPFKTAIAGFKKLAPYAKELLNKLSRNEANKRIYFGYYWAQADRKGPAKHYVIYSTKGNLSKVIGSNPLEWFPEKEIFDTSWDFPISDRRGKTARSSRRSSGSDEDSDYAAAKKPKKKAHKKTARKAPKKTSSRAERAGRPSSRRTIERKNDEDAILSARVAERAAIAARVRAAAAAAEEAATAAEEAAAAATAKAAVDKRQRLAEEERRRVKRNTRNNFKKYLDNRKNHVSEDVELLQTEIDRMSELVRVYLDETSGMIDSLTTKLDTAKDD